VHARQLEASIEHGPSPGGQEVREAPLVSFTVARWHDGGRQLSAMASGAAPSEHTLPPVGSSCDGAGSIHRNHGVERRVDDRLELPAVRTDFGFGAARSIAWRFGSRRTARCPSRAPPALLRASSSVRLGHRSPGRRSLGARRSNRSTGRPFALRSPRSSSSRWVSGRHEQGQSGPEDVNR